MYHPAKQDNANLTKLARENRKNPTLAEKSFITISLKNIPSTNTNLSGKSPFSTL
jgi:hypothetical protein